MYRSISMPLTASLGNKRVREVGGPSVVTFSTNFYKPSHVFAKRLLDVVGASLVSLDLWTSEYRFGPLIRKDGGPAFFVQKRSERTDGILTSINSALCAWMPKRLKRSDGAKYHMTGGMFKMENDPR